MEEGGSAENVDSSSDVPMIIILLFRYYVVGIIYVYMYEMCNMLSQDGKIEVDEIMFAPYVIQ